MSDRITWEELQAALAAVDPGAVLIAPRFLRRVIRRDRDLPGLGLYVPHRKSYVIDRERVRAILQCDEVPTLYAPGLPQTVILLAGPGGRRWQRIPKADLLANSSRRLFHARIDLHFQERFRAPERRVDVRRRIAEIGQAAFDEIRAVLRDEQFLFPPYDDPQVYGEFCAVFLELERFAPSLIGQYFPTIDDSKRVAALIRRDVPADELFEQTRIPGADCISTHDAEPKIAIDDGGRDAPFDPWRSPVLHRETARPFQYRLFRLSATRAARRGNDVRCVLQNAAAYRIAPRHRAAEARADADEALLRLAERLARGIRLEREGAQELQRLLPALLPPATQGFWNQTAKLLYDLQSACIDLEREHYAVDVWSWFFSFGRTPLRRPLPMLPVVLAARRLHSALRRVARIPLARAVRQQWRHVLHEAVCAADSVVRNRVLPILDAELRANGFAPTSAVERVAIDKLVEELLDIIVARGRQSLGDLRDTVARNDLKLLDVPGVREFWTGDSLRRADRALAHALDGVYRGGEFYLRWLLAFTSLAYGTRIGRLVTTHLAVPLGGAVLIVEGLQHTIFVLLKHATHGGEIHFANLWTTALTGAVVYGVLHSRKFASRLAWVGRRLSQVIGTVFVDWPSRLLRWPSVQRFLASPSFALLRRAVIFPFAIAYAVVELTPALVNTVVYVFWPHDEVVVVWPQPPAVYVGVAFVCAAAVFISPLGRRLEHFLVEQFAWTWRRLRFDLFPGFIRAVMEFFRMLLDGLERLLYAVDERLRFHTGESRMSLVLKAVVGALWLVVENLVRAVVTLTIEPQVNPIKHFPVVTVAHKIILPTAPMTAGALMPLLGTEAAALTAAILATMSAGVCGFLAWELLTNWRLYEATRPPTLRPRPFGSHGETMVRMLRPGFHSGTVPKLFAKLRRTRRAELRGADSARIERLEENMDHVAETIEQFTRRELLRMLREHSSWDETNCQIDRIVLASNRIVVVVTCTRIGSDPFSFAFEEQSGWLAVGIVCYGWLKEASAEQQSAFEWALAGFYKRCGVAIVREQLEAVLRAVVPNFDAYDIANAGLIVWRPEAETEIVYDLASEVEPIPPAPPDAGAWPLPLQSALFERYDIRWSVWNRVWMRGGDFPLEHPPIMSDCPVPAGG